MANNGGAAALEISRDGAYDPPANRDRVQLFAVAGRVGGIGRGLWGTIGAFPITLVDDRLRDLVREFFSIAGA